MLLVGQQKYDDALMVAQTCLKLDSGNTTIKGLVDELQAMKKTARSVDLPGALAEAASLLAKGETNQALLIVDQLVANPAVDANSILRCAQVYLQAGAIGKLEVALNRLVQLLPENPEAWYDLAGLRALLGKKEACFEALDRSIKLSNLRRKADPKAKDLAKEVLGDYRFGTVKSLPEFQKIITQSTPEKP
jgi:predicted Zn-dependent protease